MPSLISSPKLIIGSASWSPTKDDARKWLEALHESNITEIDTAQNYGESEVFIGNAGAVGFAIDTKCSLAVGPTVATKDEVIKAGRASLKKLKVKNVDVYYMHAPERRTTLEDTFAGINELYQQGVFKRLGLSNYSAEEVEDVVHLSKQRGWIQPTVYQGLYSAIARQDDLIRVLRKHGFSFYAYSPVAGGLLTKTRESALTEGRLADAGLGGQLYRKIFNKPSVLEALTVWGEIAEAEGVSRAELAHRWLAYHSLLSGDLGDGIVIGARDPDQLKSTVSWIQKGGLSARAVEKIQEMWESIKNDVSLNFLD